MNKGCEAQERAAHHRQAAAGLEGALDRSVFSDDSDAVEQLRARIADKRAKADRIKSLNAAIRREIKKGQGWLERIGASPEEIVAIRRNVEFDWRHQPTFPGYVLSNLRNSIRADEERIRETESRQQKAAEANAAGGLVVRIQGDYAELTFAEKPTRETLDALRAAGFTWSRGSWHGKAEKVPDRLKP